MKRLLGALVVGSLVFGTALASAATLNVNGGTIQAGSDMTLQCDADGVTVDWNFTGSDALATSIVVKGVSNDCAGQHIYTYVYDGAGNVVAVGHPYNENPLGTQVGYNDPCGSPGSAMSEAPTTIFAGTANYKIGLSMQPANTCGLAISDISGVRFVIGV